MDKLRVALVVNDLGIGGAERTVITWLRHIDRERVVPTLILLSDTGPLRAEVPADVQVVSLYGEQASRPRFLRMLLDFIRRMRSTLAQQDVVIGTCTLTHALGWAGSHLVGRPFIAWVHYVWGAQTLSGRAGWFISIAYRHIRHFVFVSEEARARFVAGAPSHALSMHWRIHNPLEHAPGPSAVQAALEAEAARRVGPTVAYVGRLHHVKDVGLLLRAMVALRRSVPSAFLAVIGDGAEREALEHENRVLAVQETLAGTGDGNLPAVFLGADPSPSAAIQGACLLALTSRYEAWGMALLEAMDLGVPVVAVSCPGGIPELVGKGADLLPGREPELLAARMRQLLGDDRERSFAQWRGKLRAQDFLPKRIMPSWTELLIRVAGRTR